MVHTRGNLRQKKKKRKRKGKKRRERRRYTYEHIEKINISFLDLAHKKVNPKKRKKKGIRWWCRRTDLHPVCGKLYNGKTIKTIIDKQSTDQHDQKHAYAHAHARRLKSATHTIHRPASSHQPPCPASPLSGRYSHQEVQESRIARLEGGYCGWRRRV